jgi:hypothetical protein
VTAALERLFAVDRDGASVAASILARIDGRLRLAGSIELPPALTSDEVLRALIRRVGATDPDMLELLGISAAAAAAGELPGWPRLATRTPPAPTLAVVAATERALRPLTEIAALTGWAVVGLSAERADALEVTRLLLRGDVGFAMIGAGDPPRRDERRTLGQVLAVATAAAARRPELTMILAGGTVSAEDAISRARAAGDQAPPGQGPIVLAPAATAGTPPGSALRGLLARVRAADDDAANAVARSTAGLAAVLGRRVETVGLGPDAGLRTTASPARPANDEPEAVVLATAALVPPDPGDDIVEQVLGWSTVSIDRYRLRDRLRELRLSPTAETHGDGAVLRLAVARAALTRLLTGDPGFATDPAPDVVVATGSAWAHAPGPAIALSLADVIRRPGASQLALDHARLLGPIGMIASEEQRLAMLSDLADDLLLPLGSILMPAGLHAGQRPGNLVVHALAGTTELELLPGALELVDLPPGEAVVVEVSFPDAVILGAAGRRFGVDVAGGLAGLLVDLRDVPLRLPDQPEQRRELLAAWQRSLWTGMET